MYIHHNDLETLLQQTKFATPLVAVYCGAKAGNNPIYHNTAFELGQALANNGLGLVYGGASIGIMGAVADGVIAGNGTAVGVIPTFLLQKEIAHSGLTALYTTDTMHTRKALMAGLASAFVVLAGGLGTLEEMMEIATWRQLEQHQKPLILLNTNDFFNYLLAHLSQSVAEGFIKQVDLDGLVVCETVEQVVERLRVLS